LETVSAVQAIILPAEAASKSATPVIVPQSVPVLVGKVIAVPLDFVVGEVPVALGKFVVLLVTATLVYPKEPIVSSVPPPASVGVAVKSPT
jgi:hypothetical protein